VILKPRALVAAALLLALLAPPAFAQTDREAARRALVTQKLKLIEQMLASPRAQSLSAEPQAKAWLTQARELIAESQRAMDANDTERAATQVDEAFRLATAATRRHGASELADSAQKQRYTELREQVNAYRGALGTSSKSARSADVQRGIDQLVRQAEQSAASGRFDEANRALTQAYQTAVVALSEARAGETVTIELKFNSPAEEFEYEQKRHRSHELLVDVAVTERKPTPATQAHIDRELVQAREVRVRADERAKAGDTKAAIQLMEQATSHLVRALQAAGMPVF